MNGAEKGAGAAILAAIKALETKIDRIAAHVGADRSASASGGNGNGNGNTGGNVATLAQIQGQYGDPKVKSDPRDWTGESCKGLPFSECPPDYLDMYAARLDFFASKNAKAGEEKKAHFDALDASRARRWAIEIREGRHKQGAPAQRMAPPPPDPETSWRGNDGGLPPPPADDGFGPPPDDDDSLPF